MNRAIELSIEEIRADFPILDRSVHGKQLIYLDNSATTQKPRQVMQAINDYYSMHNSNVHRGVHKLSEEATLQYEEAHAKAAKFVNASGGMEEIIFTKNTTESINLLAYSLGSRLRKGDEIVLTQMEHHSNLVPWQQAAKRAGASLKFLVVDRDGRLERGWEDKITKNTKVVSVVHMSNVLGTINPVSEIGKVAKEYGAIFVVDGAQSVAHMPVDVSSIGCDFLVWSSHKMLGPTGTGVLFGREDILEEMPPFLYGGDMIKEVGFERSSWNDLPWKFEAGTPNIAGGIGLGAAIDYLEKIGMDNVMEHEKSLAKHALEGLMEIRNLELYGPEDCNSRGGIVSFNVKGMHAHDMATLLDQEGIAIRGGHHCAMPLMGLLGITGSARASFYVYNTKQEIDMMIEAIGKAKKVFRID